MNNPSVNSGQAGETPLSRAEPRGEESPEQIERQIEGTRQKLARTLDALEAKLSPRQRLQAVSQSALDFGGRFAHAATKAVTPRPPPVTSQVVPAEMVRGGRSTAASASA